ncbi:cell wall-active antibiotics response protein LiaF [Paenibacillus nasutitermitis]|uniref:Cell wall-active antibiotics response LiaF-like C-terminal domain-containing protein n=1 Tax=Paenibacillus nasutitermitis TaxID=1652958 RepID=A0A916YS90_9BACL|nr:cell wall-active antibiotics response protein LiaF [Paenibacillus nasutitermitis]GGD58372.1 hypothetical protein GCM10010911_15210 [Paenibacillus nasutitermitis]
MIKKVLRNPFTGLAAAGTTIYLIISGTGYGYYDPLVWLGIGFLVSCFRSRLRWIAIIPWTVMLIMLSEGLQLYLPGVLAGAALSYTGYILLADKRSFLQKKPDTGMRVRIGRVSLRERFGDVMIRPVEIEDLSVPFGLGDVHIDLSQAIAAEGERTVVVDRIAGNVAVYLPYDLSARVEVNMFYGSLDIPGLTRERVEFRFRTETADYTQAGRKVRVVLTSVIGDVTVRYL